MVGDSAFASGGFTFGGGPGGIVPLDADGGCTTAVAGFLGA